jgi:hypothetical protein
MIPTLLVSAIFVIIAAISTTIIIYYTVVPTIPEEVVTLPAEIRFNTNCKDVTYCGDLVSVDCGAEVDGPLYYVDRNSGEIVEWCGGFCFGNSDSNDKYCRNCPPEGWTC